MSEGQSLVYNGDGWYTATLNETVQFELSYDGSDYGQAAGGRGEGGMTPRSVCPPPAPSELHDHEDGRTVIALRIDGPEDTRGKAIAVFSREWDVPFPKVRVRRTAFRYATDYAAEMEADGIPEPYDGWPFMECKDDAPGAARYWALDKNASGIS